MPKKITPIERPYPMQYLPKRFCSKCGTELFDDYIHHSYNTRDGQEMFYVESVCPNKIHFWDGHNKYTRFHEWGEDSISALFYKDGSNAR